MANNNGHHSYELTENLGVWSDNDLVNYVLDTESLMGLEKFEVGRLAQELARRFDVFVVPWEEGVEVNGEYNE
jgi:hypothetical protein